MKLLGEMMRRDPDPSEEIALDKVMGLVAQWKADELSLDSVRARCTGYERFQAMRFSTLGSPEKLALMVMVEALVASQHQPNAFHVVGERAPEAERNIAAGEQDSPPLWLTPEESADQGWKIVTNSAGQRVWVSPVCRMFDEWVYPPYEIEPGEKRRIRESAITVAYQEYRKRKGR